MLILSLSFPPLFFGGLCLYFILVHPFFFTPCSWLFSLFLFLFFLADLVSLVSLSLLFVDVCFACVYFSIVNFPWVPFSFAFLQASFVLPGALALCTLMSTLTADFGLCWGKEGGRCGENRSYKARERLLGGWSSLFLGHTYFADIHFSSWPEDWGFSPQVLRIFLICLDFTLFFFSACFSICWNRALLLLPRLLAVLLSLKHVLPITAPVQYFTYVEHPLGRGDVFKEGVVIYW